MNKNNIIELLFYHKEKALKMEGIFKRREIGDPMTLAGQKQIHVLTGVRRCGKSTLMRLLIDSLIHQGRIKPNNILYLNFEDERLAAFESDDFQTLHEAFLEIEKPEGKLFFFLDEIQNIANWQKWLVRLHEFEPIKIFVTGSNATMLSAEIATSLTGRNRILRIFPLSFREFLDARKVRCENWDFFRPEMRVAITRQFRNYLATGGFPEAVKTGDRSIVQDYFRDIVYRDIAARYRIKNILQLKKLALYLASNPGCLASLKKLQTTIGVRTHDTVKKYLGYFQEAYLFHPVSIFSYSVKQQIYNPQKLYCIDHGMAAEAGFNFSANIGRHLENMVCIELLRRGHEIYYWKDRRGREVDFVVCDKRKKVVQLIQVCRRIEAVSTRKREIAALVAAAGRFNIQRATLVTEDTLGQEEVDGVLIDMVPAWKWLLEDKEENRGHVHPPV